MWVEQKKKKIRVLFKPYCFEIVKEYILSLFWMKIQFLQQYTEWLKTKCASYSRIKLYFYTIKSFKSAKSCSCIKSQGVRLNKFNFCCINKHTMTGAIDKWIALIQQTKDYRKSVVFTNKICF